MKKLLTTILTLLLLSPLNSSAQVTGGFRQYNNGGNANGNGYSSNRNGDQYANGDTDGYDDDDMLDGNGKAKRTTFGRDTSKHDKQWPVGIFQWTIDPILGSVIPAENNDTVAKHFSNFNNTDGYNGEYSYLGNLASPRLSRIYLNRDDSRPFLFLNPLSYGLESISDFRFSNTLSPITNLAYHTCGTNQNGEDRVRAYFASNINKISGIGFKLDYLYGRGYYNSSQMSMLNGNLFGYYRGDRYEMHIYTLFGHQKNGENGGIEDDKYIYDPQSFPQKYGSRDIPVMLNDTYNRNDYKTVLLGHRYNLGYYREREVPDSLKPQPPTDAELLLQLSDSIRTLCKGDSLFRIATLDSMRNDWQSKLIKPQDFIPVSSIIHTFQLDHLKHKHYGYDTPANYYTNHYYGNINKIKDATNGLKVRNTIGLAMREGFKKWVKMGITAFATHELEHHTLPAIQGDSLIGMQSYNENNISVGGEISKTEGNVLHYNVVGSFTLAGDDIGAFDVDGKADLNFPFLKRDTVQLAAHAYIKNIHTDFYYDHFHSQSAWWDKDMDFEKRMRLEGTLTNKRSRTSLTAGFENIAKHVYLAMDNTLLEGADPASTQPTSYSHAVRVRQAGSNIQIFSATLKQDFTVGPLNWENEVTYQTTSSSNILPLPKLNVYTNLYLMFRMGFRKVLRVELGADMRYFTKYYAPDYAPNIGQFAVQDTSHPRVQIGNYPIINAYANLHIKRCRIYISVNHVNAGSGNMFLAPHCPINPLTIHWGVSWNFIN